MVTLNRIYTKTGDTGETALGDGSRRPKYDLRVVAYGTVDEANCAVGLARLHTTGELDTMLSRIQNDLFDLGADLCAPEDGRRGGDRLRIAESQVERLEREIDAMNENLKPLTSFVLPGGTAAAGASASRPRHRAPRRAAGRRAGAGGKGEPGRDPLPQPAVGSPVRREPLRQ